MCNSIGADINLQPYLWQHSKVHQQTVMHTVMHTAFQRRQGRMATMLRRSIGMIDLAVGSLSAGRATSIQENKAVVLGAVGPFIRRLTGSKALLLTIKTIRNLAFGPRLKGLNNA
jgi:hypothetical protein